MVLKSIERNVYSVCTDTRREEMVVWLYNMCFRCVCCTIRCPREGLLRSHCCDKPELQFFTQKFAVLIESGVFLPPAPCPFLLSRNIHNTQFAGQFWVKIILSQKDQVWEKESYISRKLNRNWCLLLSYSEGFSCCRKNFPSAEMS